MSLADKYQHNWNGHYITATLVRYQVINTFCLGFFADKKIIHLAEVTRNIGKRVNKQMVLILIKIIIKQSYVHIIKEKDLYMYHYISVNKKKSKVPKYVYRIPLLIWNTVFVSKQNDKNTFIKCFFYHICIMLSKLCDIFCLKIYHLNESRNGTWIISLNLSWFDFYFIVFFLVILKQYSFCRYGSCR